MTPTSRHKLLALGLAFELTFTLGAPRAAHAEPPKATASATDRARADTLKRRADTEMESLRYAEALADYDAAYAITKDPALLYNRGRVLQGMERFPEALDSLERFSREAPPELRARIPKLKELLDELRARVTTLTIRCAVPDARVLVRDKVVGTTPLPGPVRVNASGADIEVVAEGYEPFKQHVELPGNGALTVEVTLVARDAKGQLVVRTVPDGAELSVDGKPLGHAPAEAQLAPGNHVIVASYDGYRSKEVSAVVVEGQRKEVDLALDKSPPITARWWFWTGIGVVAVGAGVLTVALLTEKPAGSGDIPPGQVAGPLTIAW